MAKIKAHGKIVGRIDMITQSILFMEDGVILRNQGNGWKLWKKFKEGIDPKLGFESRLEKWQEKMKQNPGHLKLRELCIDLIPLKHRLQALDLLDLLGDDVDGIFSELTDHGLQVTFEDCARLVKARRRMLKELEKHNKE